VVGDLGSGASLARQVSRTPGLPRSKSGVGGAAGEISAGEMERKPINTGAAIDNGEASASGGQSGASMGSRGVVSVRWDDPVDAGDLSSDFTDSDADTVSPSETERRVRERVRQRRESIKIKRMACVLPHFAVRWGLLFTEVIPAVNRWRVRRWESATGISWTAERAKEAARVAREHDAVEAMRAAGRDSNSDTESDENEDENGGHRNEAPPVHGGTGRGGPVLDASSGFRQGQPGGRDDGLADNCGPDLPGLTDDGAATATVVDRRATTPPPPPTPRSDGEDSACQDGGVPAGRAGSRREQPRRTGGSARRREGVSPLRLSRRMGPNARSGGHAGKLPSRHGSHGGLTMTQRSDAPSWRSGGPRG